MYDIRDQNQMDLFAFICVIWWTNVDIIDWKGCNHNSKTVTTIGLNAKRMTLTKTHCPQMDSTHRPHSSSIYTQNLSEHIECIMHTQNRWHLTYSLERNDEIYRSIECNFSAVIHPISVYSKQTHAAIQTKPKVKIMQSIVHTKD